MRSRRPERSNSERNMKRMAMLMLGALLLLSVITTAGLHAGTPAAAPAPAGKDVKNPYEGKADAIKEGDKIFDAKCSECHMDGTGGAGPNLTDDTWIYGGSDADVFETVAFGRKGGMPSWKGELGVDNIWKVIAYIRSIHRK